MPTRKENKGQKVESEQTISKEKKAEESSKKQAALIDLSPDAIIVKNMDETITFWNKGAENSTVTQNKTTIALLYQLANKTCAV